MKNAEVEFHISGNTNSSNVSQGLQSPSAYQNKKDHEIWAEFKSGSRAAFIYIYNTYFDDLYSYARQFTNDLDLIKDAIQDIFIRLNESRHRLSDIYNIKFYLYKSIKREIINAIKLKKDSESRIAEVQILEFQYEASIEATLIEKQMDEETINKIRDAANQLNERQREIIFYHFFEGFSIREIKELMKFNSLQATHNLLNRALNHLKKTLISLFILFMLI
ncbi:MAG: RNA polymerase sigma factor [Cyclobacteriaceae bacterium]